MTDAKRRRAKRKAASTSPEATSNSIPAALSEAPEDPDETTAPAPAEAVSDTADEPTPDRAPDVPPEVLSAPATPVKEQTPRKDSKGRKFNPPPAKPKSSPPSLQVLAKRAEKLRQARREAIQAASEIIEDAIADLDEPGQLEAFALARSRDK